MSVPVANSRNLSPTLGITLEYLMDPTLKSKLFIGFVVGISWAAAIIGKHFWTDLDVTDFIGTCKAVLVTIGAVHIAGGSAPAASRGQSGHASVRGLLVVAAISIGAALALGGCATQTISNSAGPAIHDKVIVTDLEATAANLNQAVAIGVLPATDPAVGCINDVLIKTGITVAPNSTPAQTFTATNSGIVSAGSIAYIKIQLAKQLSNHPVVISPECKQLLGQMQIDGLATAASPLQTIKTLIGLPSFQ